MLPKDFTPSNSPKSRLLLCAAAVSALSAFGCATDDVGVDSETSDDLALIAPIDQQASAPNPNVPYIVDVKANGTGCPAGSWATSVSPDGETFTTTFSAYEIMLQPRQTLGVKDCILSMQMKSPSGISYAVSDFFYSGYALLPEGLTGFQTAKYWFQGNPAPANEKRTDLKGPIDDSYTFQDTVTTADVVWSPCGADRLLQVQTRLQVRRTSGNEEGYLNLAAVDGTVKGKVILKLTHRKCDTTTSGSSTTSGGSITRGR
jgi:Domain of unknown function (DUF4360)